MSRTPKPPPIQVFEDNLADARRLVELTEALLNARKHKMRRELRESFGTVMGLSKRAKEKLDCVESKDVFVILKPDGAIRRHHFTESELRPLLRQALVAISAAVESYVAEKACSFISTALDQDELPARLRTVPASLGDMIDIQRKYQRHRWGYRNLLEKYVETEASSHPDKIGLVFSVVGKREFWKQVDQKRGKSNGTSRAELLELAERRNRIAHTGDRVGNRRATLSLQDVRRHLSNAKSIAEALDEVL